MSELVSAHYDKKYFDWQASLGEFGGWANLSKFTRYLSDEAAVLDFGCGGGFLLKNIQCAKRVGVEVNPAAAETARKNGIEVYDSAAEVPDDYVDVIISNNALEHTLQPIKELKELYKKLKVGGTIVFIVPCETIKFKSL